MEPPGGLPPDRDRQLVLRPQQQEQQLVPLVPQVKPTLALNLYSKDQAVSFTIATTPAADVIVAASTENAAASSTTTIRTTNALVLASASNVVSVIAAGNTSTAPSTSPALASTAIAISGTTQAATAFSGSAVGVQHTPHHQHPPHHQPHHPPHQMHHFPHHQPQAYGAHNSSTNSSLLGGISSSSSSSTSVGGQQQTIEKLARPMAFDKVSGEYSCNDNCLSHLNIKNKYIYCIELNVEDLNDSLV